MYKLRLILVYMQCCAWCMDQCVLDFKNMIQLNQKVFLVFLVEYARLYGCDGVGDSIEQFAKINDYAVRKIEVFYVELDNYYNKS